MRVVHVSTYDRRGGAAIASARLHQSLRRRGVTSLRLIQRKDGDDPGTLAPAAPWGRLESELRPRLASLPVRRYPRRRPSLFSAAALPDRLLPRLAALAPDLVHLHWVGHGFLRLETIPKLPRPIVWTLHDSWPFTGGCHVPFECVRYRETCGSCPALGSSRDADLSRRVWERKRGVYHQVLPVIVAPSRWMASAARSSSLLRDARVEIIPNGVDLDRFRPLERARVREQLGLPLDKRIVLLGGLEFHTDRNKGGHLLRAIASRLGELGLARRTLLAMFGAPASVGEMAPGLETRSLGYLSDEASLARLYAAADVYVLPSLQENQPNTVLEAMACGTPSVAFDSSGVSELVEHGRDGFLAPPFAPEGIADGIAWILEEDERRGRLGQEARRRAERDHDLDTTAHAYATLYESMVRAHGDDSPCVVP
jgi:glycosyltransferase involved in cell wall biosynthesis